jgi:hypothetical protein
MAQNLHGKVDMTGSTRGLVFLIALGLAAGCDDSSGTPDAAASDAAPQADGPPQADAAPPVIDAGDTDGPASPDAATGQPDAGGAGCLFEGYLELESGDSKCPCEHCDEVVFCDDGILSMAECIPGMWCVPIDDHNATCVCNNVANGYCPDLTDCPDDPDCE